MRSWAKKNPTQDIDISNVVTRIIKLNSGLCDFWSKASGWAPDGAATLMSKSRLDRQVSLSKCLQLWLSSEVSGYEEGALILAWANLGSLIEGTLKLFLSVYYEDYKKEIISNIQNIEANKKYLKSYKDKKGNMIDPDILTLEKLRIFFNKNKIWSEEWNNYVSKVQIYRNAIHAYQDKEIGTMKEFEESVRYYLKMVAEFNDRMPYPDDIYVPRQI